MLTGLIALTAMQGKTPTLDIPKNSWVEIYFELVGEQSIDGRAKVSKLPNLRTTLLPRGEEEIRIWEGFGLAYLEGLRLQFKEGRWKASHILPLSEKNQKYKDKNFLLSVNPVDSWKQFWKELTKQSFYTLPDFDSLPGQKATVLDGVGHVVEIQRQGNYRTYLYSNPDRQPKKWKELEQFLRIRSTLRRSFPTVFPAPG
jgi:hypothetical protein